MFFQIFKIFLSHSMAGRKGWYKVQNSPEFKPFMEKFLLPTAVDKSTTAKEFTRWGYNFKEHLKNAVHSYFNHHCGEHDNQGEWVEKRWELRKMLLHKHMVKTLLGQSVVVRPTTSSLDLSSIADRNR